MWDYIDLHVLHTSGGTAVPRDMMQVDFRKTVISVFSQLSKVDLSSDCSRKLRPPDLSWSDFVSAVIASPAAAFVGVFGGVGWSDILIPDKLSSLLPLPPLRLIYAQGTAGGELQVLPAVTLMTAYCSSMQALRRRGMASLLSGPREVSWTLRSQQQVACNGAFIPQQLLSTGYSTR